MLARWFAVAVLALNAIDMMFFVPAYPFWALTIIAMDVVALYGLCAYGTPGGSSSRQSIHQAARLAGRLDEEQPGAGHAARQAPIAAGISLDRPPPAFQDEGGTRDTSEHGGDHVEENPRFSGPRCSGTGDWLAGQR